MEALLFLYVVLDFLESRIHWLWWPEKFSVPAGVNFVQLQGIS